MNARPPVKKGAPRLPRLKGDDIYGCRERDTYYIYAYLTADHQPLYVGMSFDVQSRNAAHHVGADWYVLAAEFRILWSTTDKREALAAEAMAIRELTPTFNVLHNRRAA